MTGLRNLFESFDELDSYKRVDGTHPLDLYVGKDEMSRWTMLLVTDIQPVGAVSSRMIKTSVGARKDGRWTLVFSLMDDTYEDMFILFCSDIIDTSRNLKNTNKAAAFIVNRYKEWKEMLANSRRTLLSSEEVKGLLGEMFCLQKYLAPQYGMDQAVMSWTGPRYLPQDFIIGETWYEVKTISGSCGEVKISSVEQLDSSVLGELVVINAEKTSPTNENAINLNLLYNEILSSVSNDDTKAWFSNMLLRYGYCPRPEYELPDYLFEVKGVAYYRVDSSFPCLRRNEIPPSVLKVKYSLSLTAISNYRKE